MINTGSTNNNEVGIDPSAMELVRAHARNIARQTGHSIADLGADTVYNPIQRYNFDLRIGVESGRPDFATQDVFSEYAVRHLPRIHSITESFNNHYRLLNTDFGREERYFYSGRWYLDIFESTARQRTVLSSTDVRNIHHWLTSSSRVDILRAHNAIDAFYEGRIPQLVRQTATTYRMVEVPYRASDYLYNLEDEEETSYEENENEAHTQNNTHEWPDGSMRSEAYLNTTIQQFVLVNEKLKKLEDNKGLTMENMIVQEHPAILPIPFLSKEEAEKHLTRMCTVLGLSLKDEYVRHLDLDAHTKQSINKLLFDYKEKISKKNVDAHHKQIKALVDLGYGDFTYPTADLKKAYDDISGIVQNAMNNYQSALTRLTQHCIKMRKQIGQGVNLVEIIEEVLKNPFYTLESVNSGTISFKTDRVLMTYRNKNAGIDITKDMGCFKVDYTPDKGFIAVFKHTDNLANNTLYHPHVNRQGVVCWGNATELVTELKTFNLKPVMEALEVILKTYNDESPYGELRHFTKNVSITYNGTALHRHPTHALRVYDDDSYDADSQEYPDYVHPEDYILTGSGDDYEHIYFYRDNLSGNLYVRDLEGIPMRIRDWQTKFGFSYDEVSLEDMSEEGYF